MKYFVVRFLSHLPLDKEEAEEIARHGNTYTTRVISFDGSPNLDHWVNHFRLLAICPVTYFTWSIRDTYPFESRFMVSDPIIARDQYFGMLVDNERDFELPFKYSSAVVGSSAMIWFSDFPYTTQIQLNDRGYEIRLYKDYVTYIEIPGFYEYCFHHALFPSETALKYFLVKEFRHIFNRFPTTYSARWDLLLERLRLRWRPLLHTTDD